MGRRFALWILLVIPGVVAIVVFGHFALRNYAELGPSIDGFTKVAHSGADLRAVFIARAGLMTHRINLFADGVWTLLAAIVAGIGVHGLCTMRDGKTA